MSEVSGFSLLHTRDANISNDLEAASELRSPNILSLKLPNGIHLSPSDGGSTTQALADEPVSSEGNYYRSENVGGNNSMPSDPLKSTEVCVPHITKRNARTQDSFDSEEIVNGPNPVEVNENLGISVERKGLDGELECPDELFSDIPNDVFLRDKEAYADCVRKANTSCQNNRLINATSCNSIDGSNDFENFDVHEEISKPVFQLPYVRESENDDDFGDFFTHESKEYGGCCDYSERNKQDSIAVTAKSDALDATLPNSQDSDSGDDFGNFVAHNEGKEDGNFVKFVKNNQKNFVNEISNVVTVRDSVENESCDNDNFHNFSGSNSAEPHEIIKAPTDDESEMSDFADFSAFQNAELTPPPIPPPETNSFIKNILSHIGSALDMTFSTDKRAGLVKFIPRNPFTSSEDSGFLAWLWCKGSSETAESLLTSVSTHPLSFATQQIWNTSYTYSMYLEAIGVDNQSTHPIISNQIKLLEPTPVNHNAASSCPTPPETTQSTESHSSEFHRSTSELTSTLLTGEGIVKSASDADFALFEELLSKPSTSKPIGPIADLEAEFLHSVIPPPSVIQNPAPSLPAAFLSKIPIKTTSENAIPENVSNVLKQLPDFSYLRKSILAFPVLEQTD
nr:hypothetical protein HmN_000231300 [Hymenolepis microstoma]